MPKYIVKVSRSESSFRVCIPMKLVEKLHWVDVDYVVVEDHRPHGVKIRRLFNAEVDKR